MTLNYVVVVFVVVFKCIKPSGGCRVRGLNLLFVQYKNHYVNGMSQENMCVLVCVLLGMHFRGE